MTTDCAKQYLVYVIAVAAAMAAATASAANIDTTKSEIVATFRQMNVPVDGRFGVFHGTVDFDTKNLGASRARIEIDTASFDVGAPEYNDELRKPEWFDTSRYPKAVFIATHVTPTGSDRFTATGKFTLKNKTREIVVAFVRRMEGAAQIYQGELPISRKDYAIGSAEWNETLEDKVIVKFRIAVTNK